MPTEKELDDAVRASGILDETLPDTDHDWLYTEAVHGLPKDWTSEGYTIDETVEGILSNAGIGVLAPARCTCGHTGRGEGSQHGARFQAGHGSCLIKGCGCRQFTYESEVGSHLLPGERVDFRAARRERKAVRP